nr:uncharacterized protein LOC129282409 [Lytechinus pictus]
MPHPFFGPYGNNIQYSAPSFHGDSDEDQPDPIFRMYGPKPAYGSDDEDPYATNSMRSSRTLLSYQDEEDAFTGVDHHYHDDSHTLLDNIAPEAPSFAKMAAAMMTGQGSEVAGVESEETGYEAYIMHPDMEAKIIPVDTMALINRSSNK